VNQKKVALITGISGQDGSYLADLLLSKGYEVHGLVRSTSWDDAAGKLGNLMHIRDRIHLHVGGIENHLFLYKLIRELRPDECYHLAASSFVSYSFDDEFSILNTNFTGTHHLLAVLKECVPKCRVYFAGSSEMFGNAESAPQDERTPFNPRSVYGIAKLASYHLVRNYRDKYGLFACAGILYNHESPRRGTQFVTRKITSTVARIKLGLETTLTLGNLDALRDWGYAPDYVKAMWLMLQQDQCEDYVIATGKTHSVRQFVEYAFEHAGLDYRKHVEFDQRYFRPSESTPLVGNTAKARAKLGWSCERDLPSIVREMVDADLALLADKDA
jgi:GDPmannose 4,6-dehydratase